jgi:hypothetical protein
MKTETVELNDDTRDPSASRGSHGDAIGWVMFKDGKMVMDVVWTDRDEAEKYCLGAYSGTAEVVRVYRQPQHPTLAEYRFEHRPGCVTDQMLPGWSYAEWIRGWRLVSIQRFVSC